ncbi:uncharacterized protein MELLADRAFT_101279 [Melampsora larici-populina 98AG31]|uniref:Uncharacterized protein n=1 Tax=Melampsora larici-populina (strain 98AG31 / pathotype 3-4-7) TaxID=747676 RepID=F4R477_MELLP|nr:uncharacterized protein MELLADRAFT_101279 [Melampsora larici-populina 98AG31]EGG12757.1 hypothetical protein MELLADRAFT_101279 [Melampsora larici-populina 98AG31]
MPVPTIVTEAHRPVIAALVQQGLTNRQIQHELSTHHDVHCSQSTITRARANWDLQIQPNAETQDFNNLLIRFYHAFHPILEERHGFSISLRTLAQCCNLLGLQRRKDDVDQGRVTLDDVAHLIRHAKQRADVQDSLNKWMDDYNSYKKRLDKRTALPTACAPNFCYYAPASENSVEGLVPVLPAHIDRLRAQYYPNSDKLMMTSPLWLSEFVAAAQASLQIHPAGINMENAWPTFHMILAFMHAYDSALLEIPAGQPREPTNHEQAVISVQTQFGRVPL